MKKLKKSHFAEHVNNVNDEINPSFFKLETKASRITISSNICNSDKFNQLFNIIEHTKDLKNKISTYCYQNLTNIITDYSKFLTNYTLFTTQYLNSWEIQTLFQDIAAHYYETASRYLNKASFIISNYKTNIKYFAQFISSNSFIQYNSELHNYYLDFDIQFNLTNLNAYLKQHHQNLININCLSIKSEENNKDIKKIENTINKYHNLIKSYEDLALLAINKPHIYNRLIQLILNKKLRLLKKVKCGTYNTGTHARNLNNAQISIIKDHTNTKYKYFLKVRKFDTLIGGLPRNKQHKDYHDKLNQFNETNFIYLPLIFNPKKLKSIGKTIDHLLTKDNPQILIKSEQLRQNKSSCKIHIIFNYDVKNNLATVIENSFKHNINILPNKDNSKGIDINLKHNLLTDSDGNFYSDILKPTNINNKNKFIDNINEIVILHSKPLIERNEKEIYRYNKLLRTNESLLKTYLSGLIKDWKSNNILHLVLEDLNLISDKSYYEHKDIKIKYSRLSRLLRIGQIKHWVRSMAEKQGLFTHFTNSAYTSKECNKCHYISDNNRKTQEMFKCQNPNCKHEENADINAAKNIVTRLLSTNLRNKLGKDNVYQCSNNKLLNYKLVKNIIEEEYKNQLGVVTEVSPNKLKKLNLNTKKLVKSSQSMID